MKNAKVQIAIIACALMLAGCGGNAGGMATGDRPLTSTQAESAVTESSYIRNAEKTAGGTQSGPSPSDAKDGGVTDDAQSDAGNSAEADYSEAIEQYRSALQERPADYAALQKMESDCPVAKGYVEWLYYYIDPKLFDVSFLYTQYDINGDGTEEMLVLMFEPYSGEYVLTDVISMVGGKTESILNAGARWRIYVQDDGLIAYYGSSGMSHNVGAYRIGENGEAVQIFEYEESEMADGSISKTVWNDDGSLTEARKNELKSLPWSSPAVPANIDPITSSRWQSLR